MYDLLLKNAHVVDPENGVNRVSDLAVENGKIADVKEGADGSGARKIIDLSGNIAIPGIIDTHVHVSDWIGGKAGYTMLAKAGVITAVDLAGPVEDIIAGMEEKGAGLNIAVLNALIPGSTISSENPGKDEIEKFVDDSLRRGALGVKILGGHYPLTPDAAALVIGVANSRRAYTAFHAGSTGNRGDLNGVKEALAIAGDNGVHLAHINSYCRGLVRDPLSELLEILPLLEDKPRVVSESYLARINGTSGKCVKGMPESHVTRNCLKMGGFPVSRDGLHQAILRGHALVTGSRFGENVLLHGREGAELWLEAETDTTISFEVNDPQVQFLCATAKGRDNSFLIDAISTDGGGIPRNVILEKGLSLVDFGALSLEDFVIKCSRSPARMIGASGKGHLGIGADADITVFDPLRKKAVMGINGGTIIMAGGIVTGEKGTVLTSRAGMDHLRGAGIPCREIHPDQGLLYR